jgi:hypothetical protein
VKIYTGGGKVKIYTENHEIHDEHVVALENNNNIYTENRKVIFKLY